MRVVFHPEAHAEMIEQARYYESKSEELGPDFLDAVEETERRIAQAPKPVQLSRQIFAAPRFRFPVYCPL